MEALALAPKLGSNIAGLVGSHLKRLHAAATVIQTRIRGWLDLGTGYPDGSAPRWRYGWYGRVTDRMCTGVLDGFLTNGWLKLPSELEADFNWLEYDPPDWDITDIHVVGWFWGRDSVRLPKPCSNADELVAAAIREAWELHDRHFAEETAKWLAERRARCGDVECDAPTISPTNISWKGFIESVGFPIESWDGLGGGDI